ncbi:hypothetical protein MKZ07_25085 [Paenibacillus sp. FSL P4-0338]|uniref:hypothetical protein n=1 Tax=unclassified Paenibacillus TaxID=185978 RepID=UPI0012EC57DB|nr:hypothetical protein [Paenibacillus sp. FSL R7-269]
MEAKNAPAAITDSEFADLLTGVRLKQPEAMLQIIELFQEDIEMVSQCILLPREDVISHIVTEILNFIQAGDST